MMGGITPYASCSASLPGVLSLGEAAGQAQLLLPLQ